MLRFTLAKFSDISVSVVVVSAECRHEKEKPHKLWHRRIEDHNDIISTASTGTFNLSNDWLKPFATSILFVFSLRPIDAQRQVIAKYNNFI